jgi:hypothetical protein
MSDEPFMLDETPPIMSAEQARNIARHYKGFADHMASLGVRAEATRLERQSNWWLAYSIALAQTKEMP